MRLFDNALNIGATSRRCFGISIAKYSQRTDTNISGLVKMTSCSSAEKGTARVMRGSQHPERRRHEAKTNDLREIEHAQLENAGAGSSMKAPREGTELSHRTSMQRYIPRQAVFSRSRNAVSVALLSIHKGRQPRARQVGTW